MNFNKIFLFLTIILITVIILTTIASSEQPKSQWLNENPCMIKVVITNTEECKDSMCLIKEIDYKKMRIEYDKISTDIAKVRNALEQIPDFNLELKASINKVLNKKQAEMNRNYAR